MNISNLLRNGRPETQEQRCSRGTIAPERISIGPEYTKSSHTCLLRSTVLGTAVHPAPRPSMSLARQTRVAASHLSILCHRHRNELERWRMSLGSAAYVLSGLWS
ncbi:hypothetical protein RSAG8_07386, partial [Rhizoctonia solani AG-8 WAC10335]